MDGCNVFALIFISGLSAFIGVHSGCCTKTLNYCGKVLNNPGICGNTMGAQLKDNNLYKCTTGADPVDLGECVGPCQNMGVGKSDSCKVKACCTRSLMYCGSVLSSVCADLKPNNFYACTAGQAPVLLGECDGQCKDGGPGNNDTCTLKGCCTKTLDYCGTVLNSPGICGPTMGSKLKPNNLYRCTAGANPVDLGECDEACQNKGQGNSDSCKLKGCCTKSLDYCGSVLNTPDICGSSMGSKTKANNLYRCVAGSDPVDLGECDGACQNKGQGNSDTCKLKGCCTKSLDYCGTVLNSPGICGPSMGTKLKANNLYKCVAGSDPVDLGECDGACQNKGRGNSDACKLKASGCCTKTLDYCGSVLNSPSICGPLMGSKFKANNLYKCTVGSDPIDLGECDETCQNKGQGNSDACKLKAAGCCTETLDYCGSVLNSPSICGSAMGSKLKANNLYKCVAGNDPLDLGECDGACQNTGQGNSDACTIKVPGCCPNSLQYCGGVLSKINTTVTCHELKSNSLYDCVAGKTPVYLRDCGEGTCTNGGTGKNDSCVSQTTHQNSSSNSSSGLSWRDDSSCTGYAKLEGWKAVDAGRTLDQKITIPGTPKDDKECLRRCRSANSKCYLITFNYVTRVCSGFTRKAVPGFAADPDAVTLARTYKRMTPAKGLIFKDYGVPSGVPGMQLPNVGNEDTCKVICQLQPSCNYAVFALKDSWCWTANLPALGAQHSQALKDAHEWTHFYAQ